VQTRAPELHVEVILDIVVIPVVLPEFVPPALSRARCGAGQMRGIRSGIVPVCAWTGLDERLRSVCGGANTPCTGNSSNSSSSSSTPSVGGALESLMGSCAPSVDAFTGLDEDAAADMAVRWRLERGATLLPHATRRASRPPATLALLLSESYGASCPEGFVAPSTPEPDNGMYTEAWVYRVHATSHSKDLGINAHAVVIAL
jgi:hypothetical protein